MPTVQMRNGIDKRTGRLTVSFESENSESKYTAARFVAQCVLSSGMAPSYAFCTSPIAKFGPGNYDQKGLKVAMKRAGPAGNLKLLTRAEVNYEETTGASARLMTGWLVSHAHQISVVEDSVVTQVFDDKIILDKFTVSGCLCFDPQRNVLYWDLARPCIFNALGWPNCIDSPYGPVFAPCHRFGYADSYRRDSLSDAPALDSIEPDKGEATRRARSWDCDDAFKYLRLVHWSQRGLPPTPVDVGLTKLPHYINWPASLGNVFGTTQRVLKHESMQGADGKGTGLGLALQTIARKAGAYDIYMKPAAAFRSEISLIDLNPGQNTGTMLLLPDYLPGIRNCIASNAIKEGYIMESAVDYFHETCMQGDAPSVELMISMPEAALEDGPFESNPSATDDGVPEGLEPAWSQEDHLLAKIYVANHEGADEENFGEALAQAFDLYPWWLAAYRVTQGFNPWKGTKWDKSADGGTCMMNGGRMRFKPFLNTGYQMDSASPANWQPREIVVEKYKNEEAEIDSEANPWGPEHLPVVEWQRLSKLDNLTLSADSTIMIVSALRGSGQTYYIKQIVRLDEDHNPIKIGKDSDHIYPRPIRATVALEADWPLTGRKGKDDPNFTADRVNQSFKYCWRVSAPAGDYQELLRRGDSYPVGKAKLPPSITTSFPPRCTEGHELFTDRKNENSGILPDHATTRLRDVKRIAYYAKVRIPCIAPAMRPGMTIEIVGANSLRCKTVTKSVQFSMVGTTGDPKEKPAVPDTWIECGPPDLAVLMGDPAAGHAVVSGGGSYEPPDTTPGEYPGTSGGTTTPGTSDETGGKHQTQEQGEIDSGGKSQTKDFDEYQDNASGLGGTDTNRKGAGQTSDETMTSSKGPVKVTSDETKSSTPGTSSSWSTPGGKYENANAAAKVGAGGKGADRAQHQQERKDRKKAEHAENAKQHAADKAQQRAGNGIMIDANGNAHNSIMGKGTPGFGEASSGSMTDASGKTHTGIMGKDQPGFGEAGSGRMGNVTDLNKAAGSMFDTSKADAHDRKNYKPTPRDNDPGAMGAIAKSFGQQDAFKRHQIDKVKPKEIVKEQPFDPKANPGNPLGNSLKAQGNAPGFKKDAGGFDVPGSNQAAAPKQQTKAEKLAAEKAAIEKKAQGADEANDGKF